MKLQTEKLKGENIYNSMTCIIIDHCPLIIQKIKNLLISLE